MTTTDQVEVGGDFRVSVGGFEGPFDLLLDLIGRHELEITELSLSRVTDEFLAHLERLGTDADLGETSAFLVVGATLLDAKIAGLLPQGEVVDAESVAMLEARDLLFARLLQYRAYKEATAWFVNALELEARRQPHPGALEDRHRPAAPPIRLDLAVGDFARLAEAALAPKAPPTVRIDHLHAPLIDLRLQAAEVVALLRRSGSVAFPDLVGPLADRPVVVARFLAVLELHRQGAVAFDQLEPLGALLIRWTAPDWDDTRLARLGGGLDE